MLPIFFCKIMLPKIDSKNLLRATTLQPQFSQCLVPYCQCSRFPYRSQFCKTKPNTFLTGIQSLLVNSIGRLSYLVKNSLLSLFSLFFPICLITSRNCAAEIREVFTKK